MNAYSRYDSKSGQYFCAVNVSEPQEADWTNIQQEFPRVDALAILAKASDRQGTYTYSESFPNRIPYVPNMRVRVLYPHEETLASPSPSSKSSFSYTFKNLPTPGNAGGKPLPGCVELQPSAGEVSAFVDVYGKTQWHSGSIRASTSASEDKPVVIAHEDVSAVLVEQEEQRGGWTRYRYLITPNLKTQKSSGTGAFEQRVIKFAQPFTGITKEICVFMASVTSTAGIVQSRMPHPQCPVFLDAVHVGSAPSTN